MPISNSEKKFCGNVAKKTEEKNSSMSLYGAAKGFAIAQIIGKCAKPVLIVTADLESANRLQLELEFFRGEKNAYPILHFPNFETLPYDHFSPHQDIISERLLTLYRLPSLKTGAIIAAVNTLMQRLPPRDYLEKNSFVLRCGEKLGRKELRLRLERYGYRFVQQVFEHGEFAVRGSLFDLFPMGSSVPYRIDLFDEEVDSIRTFDPETQITIAKINAIELLPAREFPLSKEAIIDFRQNWREIFSGDPSNCPIYQNISRGESSSGIEYYLKLFFTALSDFFAYLPRHSLIIKFAEVNVAAEEFWQEIKERYEQLRHDRYRPILSPEEIFLPVDEFCTALNAFPIMEITADRKSPLPDLHVDYKAKKPLAKLAEFLKSTTMRVLFCAESMGRRESILKLLTEIDIRPNTYDAWQEFLAAKNKYGIIIVPLQSGAYLQVEFGRPAIALITESELFGEQIVARRSRKKPMQDPETAIRNLTELKLGDPIVHLDHGVGRYLGLQKIKTLGEEGEFLELEYADQAKLYVPVTTLHLIRRYTGAAPESAPLNRLGAKGWEKAKREAIKKVRDVAVELLNIYAQRAAKTGFAFTINETDYMKFSRDFPFEETEDQARAISDTIADMAKPRAMDRLICGDVGFGKTEVAMRAAFIAVSNNKQVAVLAPTTILSEQHYRNFHDRFADWPVQIDMLSRFRSFKEQNIIIDKLKQGKIDIIIGTHKILQPKVVFKDLGLLIIDEEHRFGVKQKELIKALRPEIDVLTLTATPIPRTLNMALSGIRDFSIITSPPRGRLAIKTFVRERDDQILREAILREILRGGQIYFLHNDIASIDRMARELEKLLPNARIMIAHGKMPGRDLENIMSDFYHRRFNLLVCTTIIESGIDVPTANTIIINRADKFGLAQLHQLRGRVGRSHHQAYAYLLTPPPKLMTQDALKRLDALAAMEDLGIGFVLATHDLEIRGAGELLGEEQSGQIAAIGFDLYMEYLERAVKALQSGEKFDLDLEPKLSLTEIDLQIPAFIPDDYVRDVNTRLILYKRIANARNAAELESLQVEIIDRFGLLKQQVKNLFSCMEIKLSAEPLGISRVIANVVQGSIDFIPHPNVDVKKIIALVQKQPQIYKLKAARLEFKKSMKSVAELVTFIEELLVKLAT